MNPRDNRFDRPEEPRPAGELVATVPFSRGGEIRVTFEQRGPRKVVSLRKWFRSEGAGGGFLPSKLGVEIPPDLLDATIRALRAAQDKLTERPTREAGR